MKRTLRLGLVAMATLAIVGVAFAAPAAAGCGSKSCTPSAAKADSKTASSSCGAATAASADTKVSADCAAKCASAGKTCTAEEKAACASKAAKAAMADCSYCNFMTDLHANADKVTLSSEETKNGVIVVFAATTKDNVPVAQALATKAHAMMSKPAACAVTKAKMADASCGGCKEGIEAFSKSTVTMEETAEGSKAMVSTEDKKTVEELHAFFRALSGQGSEG